MERATAHLMPRAERREGHVHLSSQDDYSHLEAGRHCQNRAEIDSDVYFAVEFASTSSFQDVLDRMSF